MPHDTPNTTLDPEIEEALNAMKNELDSRYDRLCSTQAPPSPATVKDVDTLSDPSPIPSSPISAEEPVAPFSRPVPTTISEVLLLFVQANPTTYPVTSNHLHIFFNYFYFRSFTKDASSNGFDFDFTPLKALKTTISDATDSCTATLEAYNSDKELCLFQSLKEDSPASDIKDKLSFLGCYKHLLTHKPGTGSYLSTDISSKIDTISGFSQYAQSRGS